MQIKRKLKAVRAIEAVVDVQRVPLNSDFSRIDGGVDGMLFIAIAVQSAKAGAVWTKMARAGEL